MAAGLGATALKDIGLRAILDMTNFTRNALNFDREVKKMNSVVENLVSNLKSRFQDSGNDVSRWGEAVKRVGSIVAGIIVADIFRGFNRAIGDVIEQTTEAIDTFQKLEIQMETILARDFAKAFGVPIEEAFKSTSGQAEILLSWITKVAVTTPFSAQSVGKVFALANAYGFTTKEAQRMVLTVGDFTASMGGGNEVLERIIYNLGQMEAAGRPTGRELRDLSNNFVPIATIADRFAKSMDTSREAILEMFREGTISSREFTEEFLSMIEETVPGAMARMSRTFQTVKTNLQDLIQLMLGFRIFGPIAEEIAANLQGILESLLTDEIQGKASNIGQALLFSYKKLSDYVSTILVPVFKDLFKTLGLSAPTLDTIFSGILRVTAFILVMANQMAKAIINVKDFIQDVQEYFSNTFQGTADKATGWGQNIILSLAKGMSWAVQSVLNVIMFIGRAIAKLLKPGSPPLLLPDLDVWGAEAMTTYMEGWKNGDFSVFNDVGNILERAISSWKEKIGEEEVITRILGSKVTLATVIEEYRKFGVVSAEAMNSLVESVGIASEHITMFLEKSLELTKFSEIKQEVSDLFDFEGIGQVNLFGNVVDSFQDIIDLAGQFGDDLSASVISYAMASERLIEVNQLIKATQDAVNKSTKEYDDLLDALNARLNKVKDRQVDITRIAQIDEALSKVILTATERERLELEKEQILLEREIRLVKEQRDAEKEAAETAIEGLKEEQDTLENKIKEEKKLIEETSKANVQALENELKALKDIIDAQISLNELINRQVTLRSGGGAGGAGGEDPLEGVNMGEWGLGAVPEMPDITALLDEMWLDIKKQVDDWWAEVKEPFQPVSDAFKLAIDTWKGVLEDPEVITGWNNFVEGIGKGFDLLVKFWDNNGEEILESLGTLLGTIIIKLFGNTESTGKSVIEIIADAFVAFGESLNENGDKITKFIDDVSDFIANTSFDTAKDFFKDLATVVLPAIGKFVIESLPKILDLLVYIVNNAEGISKVAISAGLLMIAIVAISNAGKIVKTANIITTVLFWGTAFTRTKKKIEEASEKLHALDDKVVEIFSGKAIEEKDIVGPIDWTATSDAISTWWTDTVLPIFRNENAGEKVIVEPIDWDATGAAITTWWDGLFGENGTLTTGQNDAKKNMGTWATETYGADSDFNTELQASGVRLRTWWEGLFGENGDVTTDQTDHKTRTNLWMIDIYGINGIIASNMATAGTSIETWWKDTFGEGGTVPTWFETSFGGFDEWIQDIFGPEGVIMTWLNTAEEDIDTWWSGLFGEEGTISGWFKTAVTNFTTFGGDLVAGMIAGLGTGATDLYNAVKGLISNALSQGEEESGSHSPSKKFADLTKTWMQGMEGGVEDNSGLVYKAVDALVSTSMEVVMRRLSAQYGNVVAGSSSRSSQTVNHNQYISMSMNPTYENVQSPSSVYYDMTAALASVRR